MSALNQNSLYIADNGQIVCHCCAGSSAKATGRDISGQPLYKITSADIAEFGGHVSCERGCMALSS